MQAALVVAAKRVATAKPQDVLETAAGTGVVTRAVASLLPDARIVATDLNQLMPSGRFFFSVWDRISENEFADVVTQALASFFPKDPPRFLARTPHGYYDADRIREELNAAGSGDISIDAVDAKSKASSPLDPAIAYCKGTPLRNEIEARNGAGLEDATRHAAKAFAERFGPGVIEGRIRAIIITAIC